MAGYVEVRAYAELNDFLAPESRGRTVLRCNGRLAAVGKDEVIEHLEPLTRRYYDDFSRCADCGRVYWRGSHHGRLVNPVARLRDRLQGERSHG